MPRFFRLRFDWTDERREALRNSPWRLVTYLPFAVSIVALIGLLYVLGFDLGRAEYAEWHMALAWCSFAIVLFIPLRHILFYQVRKLRVWMFDGMLVLAALLSFLTMVVGLPVVLFRSHEWLLLLFAINFLRELSALNLEFKRTALNPAQLFVFSFLCLMLLGAIFLTFPNATKGGLSFVDALFTSTSAVCVTGLALVDTGSYFTFFGQGVLLFLIQVGGLGIMTFTSYFSYFFKGDSSYENQLIIQEMTGSDKIAEVFGTLKHVLIITFTIEALGALLLYVNLSGGPLDNSWERVWFAVFHSISAFCNAGFSTAPSGLFADGFRHEYDIQVTIGSLIIFGGIGFPILYNFWSYFKHVITDWLFQKKRRHAAWIINLNTRIVGLTTLILLVLGTVGYYLLEREHIFAEHEGIGKWVGAFFASVTARTAGFNTIDYGQMTFSAIALTYFLMWVGASPASTGGGIKTSTFAVSLLNSFSIAKGRSRLEAFGREISDMTVKRAYSQVFLSIMAIGLSVLLVSWFNPTLTLRTVIFECVSAFSTVGLTMGITPQLAMGSKLVIIATMFVGRISLLTLMAAVVRQVRFKQYRYPTEDITIS